MQHTRQPVRAVSAGVRARACKYETASITSSCSSITLDGPTSIVEVVSTAELPPVYEPSWRRTGRSSMAASVRIPSFLIPCSASQLMDARYKSRKFSRSTVDANAISPAA
ncbi:hypothetical protein DVH05_025762 [Phytophthora capsici]|nr:hypothetical protein DVH05_025762 [Phytophthora capsici]|eukprot:jgi/Phyca11/555778/estExt2_Genewise1Plus.C_PHYCAscaffold_780050